MEHSSARLLLLVVAVALQGRGARSTEVAPEYRIGVYYFPGWIDGAEEARPLPWKALTDFPDRVPLLGKYQETDVGVASKQIAWMRQYGIDFVLFDWYWIGGRGPKLSEGLHAFEGATNFDSINFALLWANHSGAPVGLMDFDRMVDSWVAECFWRSNYLQVDGKPVVVIFSPDALRKAAGRFGLATSDLLKRARARVMQRGYAGIYFVACAQPEKESIGRMLPREGFDALTAYNYHLGCAEPCGALSRADNYSQLARGYEYSWDFVLRNSELPYWLPVTAGWDPGPWSGHAPYDHCLPSLSEFKRHLLSARRHVDEWPKKSNGMVVIYAWNEFGEGGYVEPTIGRGMSFLRTVRSVFGRGQGGGK